MTDVMIALTILAVGLLLAWIVSQRAKRRQNVTRSAPVLSSGQIVLFALFLVAGAAWAAVLAVDDDRPELFALTVAWFSVAIWLLWGARSMSKQDGGKSVAPSAQVFSPVHLVLFALSLVVLSIWSVIVAVDDDEPERFALALAFFFFAMWLSWRAWSMSSKT